MPFEPPPTPPAIVSTLEAPESADGDELGRSVGWSEPYAVAGAWGATRGGLLLRGSAHVWRRTTVGWIDEGQLLAPDGAAGDQFGVSVGVSTTGDGFNLNGVAVVGAFTADLPGKADAGAAYVFRRDTASAQWVMEAKLVAGDAAASDQFGRSVAVDGDTIAVGCWKKTGSRGAVYVFRHTGGGTWVQKAKLTAPDAFAGDGLGVSVDVDAGRVVAGAWGDDIGTNINQGSAYVFAEGGNGWFMQSKLVAPNGAASDECGRSVAIEGNRAIVGTWPFFGSGIGRAFIFEDTGPGTWIPTGTLSAPVPQQNDNFGFAVGLAGEAAVVGAYGDDEGLQANQGSVHVFIHSGGSPGGTWTHVARLVREDGQANDNFGISVSAADELCMVGANLDDGGSLNEGSITMVWAQDCNGDGAGGLCEALPGDTDGDAVVTFNDLGYLLGSWGPVPPGHPADANHDGMVDGYDLGILLSNWTVAPP